MKKEVEEGREAKVARIRLVGMFVSGAFGLVLIALAWLREFPATTSWEVATHVVGIGFSSIVLLLLVWGLVLSIRA